MNQNDLKVVVFSRTGSVGKTILASNFLLPRMKNPRFLSMDDMNSTAAQFNIETDGLDGSGFQDIISSVFVDDNVLIDVGQSCARFFLEGLKSYVGSSEEFDFFIVPFTPVKRHVQEAADSIESLLHAGVDPKKIIPIANQIPTFFRFDELSEFGAYCESRGVQFNADWHVKHHNTLEGFVKHNVSIEATLQDKTDYKEKIKALQKSKKAADLNLMQDYIQKRSLQMVAKSISGEFDELWVKLPLYVKPEQAEPVQA